MAGYTNGMIYDENLETFFFVVNKEGFLSWYGKSTVLMKQCLLLLLMVYSNMGIIKMSSKATYFYLERFQKEEAEKSNRIRCRFKPPTQQQLDSSKIK